MASDEENNNDKDVKENTLTSNELYFSEVENEHGKELNLEESLRNNLVALLTDRFTVFKGPRRKPLVNCLPQLPWTIR